MKYFDIFRVQHTTNESHHSYLISRMRGTRRVIQMIRAKLAYIFKFKFPSGYTTRSSFIY